MSQAVNLDLDVGHVGVWIGGEQVVGGGTGEHARSATLAVKDTVRARCDAGRTTRRLPGLIDNPAFARPYAPGSICGHTSSTRPSAELQTHGSALCPSAELQTHGSTVRTYPDFSENRQPIIDTQAAASHRIARWFSDECAAFTWRSWS